MSPVVQSTLDPEHSLLMWMLQCQRSQNRAGAVAFFFLLKNKLNKIVIDL